jgi:trehalose synthase
MMPVDLCARSLDRYHDLLDAALYEGICSTASSLRGLAVLHVNATPTGGGVAEVLRSLVPMMNDVGLRTSWRVIDPDPSFFSVTKKLHNGLQGKPTSLTPEEIERYWSHNRWLAEQLAMELAPPDVIVVHDAQVLPLASFLTVGTHLVWQCHVDVTNPDERVRDLIAPLSYLYGRIAVSMPSYVMPGLPLDRVRVFQPAIDPLSPKNTPLPIEAARHILAGLGIDPSRPLITQVSRFDTWKDPWGVIDAYRLAKEDMPGLQLALVGALNAVDDPEGVEVLGSVVRYTSYEPYVHLFSDPAVLDDLVINAFQTASAAIIQKSLREGFGLTVTEAMWKGTPVIGGDCGGIRCQIDDGRTGYLVRTPEGCAERIVDLLRHPEEARQMGAAGRESVCQRFLMPRLLLDYLRLFEEMLREPTQRFEAPAEPAMPSLASA